MKRHLLEKDVIAFNKTNNGSSRKTEQSSNLSSLPEYPEQIKIEKKNNRPTTLIFQQESFNDVTPKPTTSNNSTPHSVFTEYRDTKPPYLKFSRDDFDVEKLKNN